MDLSVIIASYNRGDALVGALRSLAASKVPAGLLWEALVVDNNSTDHTRSLVGKFITEGNSNFRYLSEPRQGKSFALNTGVRAAQGKIIAMTDDDCVVDSRWIGSIVQEFTSDSSLAMLGGRVELYNPVDEPMTVRMSKQKVEVSVSPFEPCSPPIIGCNVAFKGEIFTAVGYFDHRLGPGSRRNLVAEDVDYLYRVYKKGLKIIYSPDVLVYHNHGRRIDVQGIQVSRNYLRGRGAFYCKHIVRADREVLKYAYWEVRGLVKEALNHISGGHWPSRQLTCLHDMLRGAIYRAIQELQQFVMKRTELSYSLSRKKESNRELN
jgi:GT2 family glycosyltransferase